MTKLLLAAGLFAMFSAAGPAAAQTGVLGVELNKLEESGEGACRAFFLFRNGLDESFEAFALSVATIDADGVIDRLLSIDAAPLPAARTTLKLFEIPETSCADISEILVHEIEACRPQNGEDMDCFPILSFASKAPVALVK